MLFTLARFLTRCFVPRLRPFEAARTSDAGGPSIVDDCDRSPVEKFRWPGCSVEPLNYSNVPNLGQPAGAQGTRRSGRVWAPAEEATLPAIHRFLSTRERWLASRKRILATMATSSVRIFSVILALVGWAGCAKTAPQAASPAGDSLWFKKALESALLVAPQCRPVDQKGDTRIDVTAEFVRRSDKSNIQPRISVEYRSGYPLSDATKECLIGKFRKADLAGTGHHSNQATAHKHSDTLVLGDLSNCLVKEAPTSASTASRVIRAR
jgi:hypothetical protein